MEHGKNISFRDIELDNGFWADKQKLVNETSIYAVWDRFKETGRFDAFKCDWKEGMENKPHIFWDSDVAKWIESVAYILHNSKLLNRKDDKLEAAVEELIDLIEKNQDSNGYFNIYFTVCEPKGRWTKRYDHELYCAGHLIEAAVAYFQTTGKDRFLKLMCKYADYIEKVFLIDKTALFFTPGHEEIELALVKLYHATAEKRYLNLSKHFLDLRSTNKAVEYNNNTQDDVPVRQINEAVGHSVRAVYLYSAMADVADEFEDNELFDACRKVFENIAFKRMYITGGIGSSPRGEAFSVDYDLPNMTAYSESCAALGLVLFARRMSRLDPNSIYADIAEKVMYNGFLSSISLDGVSFFYENPLEINPALHKRPEVLTGAMRFPPIRRQKVFGCSCCPPNITRFIPSIADNMYTYNNECIFIHQYMASHANIEGNSIIQATNYPVDDNIKITVTAKNKLNRIAVRIPNWCKKYNIYVDGKVTDYELKKGYAYIEIQKMNSEIEIMLDMPVTLMEASPNVQENSGRVAVQRGPVVYCLEQVDNGKLLRDVSIELPLKSEIEYDEYFGTDVIYIKGSRRNPNTFSNLYQSIEESVLKIEQKLKFIPYYAFSNRDEGEMIVWVLK